MSTELTKDTLARIDTEISTVQAEQATLATRLKTLKLARGIILEAEAAGTAPPSGIQAIEEGLLDWHKCHGYHGYRATQEASMIGLAPGHWPQELAVPTSRGLANFKRGKRLHLNGETTGYIYEGPEKAYLTLLND